MRICLPVVLTVILFVATIFGLILPMQEDRMMAGKRETIQALTNAVCSGLEVFAQKEADGSLSSQDARQQALTLVRNLRYGPEGKDYFWINDMQPRMLVHTYRPDLEGHDVSDFTDPDGKRIFMECVRTVETHGAGYVDYSWQWKDDPKRIVPKISYVKGFDTWGWIVGTGIYVEDVRAEIGAITRTLTLICLGILMVIVGLSAYVIWQGTAAERQAHLHQEQLYQADKMATLGTLVSGVAHEINNPVMAIMLNTPILQRTWQDLLPIVDEYERQHGDFDIGGMKWSQLRERMPMLLSNTADGARRVKEIVTDLKDFARQDPGEMRDRVNLNQAARKAVGLVANLIKKSTDHFAVDYASDLPPFNGNAQRIEQVIINLLVNACQALPEKGCEIRLQTHFDALRQRVVLSVRDQGEGMSPSVMGRIKDPFFTTKRETGGTGLGLSISDRIIRDHGGELTYQSIPGAGTTARMTIPVAATPQP